MLEPDPPQHLLRFATPHGRSDAHDPWNERGVLEDRHPPEELEVLEDEPDVPAIRLGLARTHQRQILAVDGQSPVRQALLAQEQPEQRRFAGAAGAGQEYEFAFVDNERQVTECVTPPVGLGEVLSLYHSSSPR